MHVDAPDLLLHVGRVDLAHVAAAVLLDDAPHVETPDAVPVVAHLHAGVVSDHASVHREDRLSVHVDPSHLGRDSAPEYS